MSLRPADRSGRSRSKSRERSRSRSGVDRIAAYNGEAVVVAAPPPPAPVPGPPSTTRSRSPMPGAYDAGMMQYEVRDPTEAKGGRKRGDPRMAGYGQTSRYTKEESTE